MFSSPTKTVNGKISYSNNIGIIHTHVFIWNISCKQYFGKECTVANRKAKYYPSLPTTMYVQILLYQFFFSWTLQNLK